MQHLNAVANDPQVRPWLGGEGELDLGPLLATPGARQFTNEHGGFIVHPLFPGIYEVHSLFLPEGKGTAASLARESIREMFTRSDCARLVTKVPDTNEAAKHLAHAVGFREEFRRENVEQWGCGVSYQTLTLERWRDNDPACLEAGQWFHDRIEAEKAKAGSELTVHPDDPAHDRVAGACVLMCRAGQVMKGVILYNAWAVFAGYRPIDVLESGALDIGDAVLAVVDGDFEVIECR